MVANRTAAPKNADTMLAVVKVMNMVLILSPIKAANTCRKALACPCVACFITNVMPRIATKGAKITTHLMAVPNNTAIKAGLDETNKLTIMINHMLTSWFGNYAIADMCPRKKVMRKVLVLN